MPSTRTPDRAPPSTNHPIPSVGSFTQCLRNRPLLQGAVIGLIAGAVAAALSILFTIAVKCAVWLYFFVKSYGTLGFLVFIAVVAIMVEAWHHKRGRK